MDTTSMTVMVHLNQTEKSYIGFDRLAGGPHVLRFGSSRTDCISVFVTRQQIADLVVSGAAYLASLGAEAEA